MKSIFYLIIIFCVGCQNNHSDDIILEIGDLKITQLEFQVNQNKYFPDKIDKNDKKYLKWKSDYIDRCYAVCDALQKGYDTISDLDEQVNSVARFMMVQKYGPLWKAIISPTVDEFKIPTKEKLNLRGNLYYFDIIQIKDDTTLSKLNFKNKSLKSVEEFNNLKSKAENSNGLSSNYSSMQWPFWEFWGIKDDLTLLSEGEISKLLKCNDRYYFFYLDRIEKIMLTEEDTKNLMTELQLGIEKEIDDKLTIKSAKKCKLEMDSISIMIILNQLLAGNDILDIHDDLHLMSYNLQNQKKKIFLSNFQKYYKYYPLRRNLAEKNSLYTGISQYFFDDYLWELADSIGLTKVDTFLAQRNSYHNQIIFREYVNNELYNTIEIDSSQITEYYSQHMNEYAHPEKIKTHIFYFQSAGEINQKKKILTDFYSLNDMGKMPDPSFLANFNGFKFNLSINMDSLNTIDSETAELLIKAKPNEIIEFAQNVQGMNILIYKIAEEGTFIPPLEAIYERIEAKLKKDQFEILKNIRVKELKKKYKFTINQIE